MLKFYGNSEGLPFGHHNYNHGLSYILAVDESIPDFYFIYPSSGEKNKFDWNFKPILNNIEGRPWKEIPQATLEKLYKKFGKSVPKTFQDILLPTKPPFALKIAPKPMASPKISVTKGKLYFNVTTKQVERVLTVQDGSLIWTSRHKQEAKPYSKSTFRLANQLEVDNYLAEAGNQV